MNNLKKEILIKTNKIYMDLEKSKNQEFLENYKPFVEEKTLKNFNNINKMIINIPYAIVKNNDEKRLLINDRVSNNNYKEYIIIFQNKETYKFPNFDPLSSIEDLFLNKKFFEGLDGLDVDLFSIKYNYWNDKKKFRNGFFDITLDMNYMVDHKRNNILFFLVFEFSKNKCFITEDIPNMIGLINSCIK